MKIVDVKLTKFKKKTWLGVDRDGHMHPSKEKMSQTAMIEIVTDDGFTFFQIFQCQFIRSEIIRFNMKFL